ncbi:uncharacterized protein LOC128214694 [Mya arenaria]|uniref:uncharacterized protein LOC128214694 n=1 Tax=Mya arenaria TaxID=6604 RepID=UPI0022E045C3|nr:uncharacterized protein LOC128214694 [Mya arenaria]XP_052777272.1 uncharacterized protein LOC128214694 [Mya arenaria]
MSAVFAVGQYIVSRSGILNVSINIFSENCCTSDWKIQKEKVSLLDQIKEEFYKEHGHAEEPIIVLFTHLMPCNDKGHRCAALLRKYVETTGDNLIVSYKAVHKSADFPIAESYLYGSKNIWFVSRRPRTDLTKVFTVESDFGDCYETIEDNTQYETGRMKQREKSRRFRLQNCQGRSDRDQSSRKKKKHFVRAEKFIEE